MCMGGANLWVKCKNIYILYTMFDFDNRTFVVARSGQSWLAPTPKLMLRVRFLGKRNIRVYIYM